MKKYPDCSTEYYHPDPVIDFTGQESLTHQEFADEADINQIIKRFQATGYLVDPSVKRVRQPVYGDFVSAPTFLQAQQILVDASERFDSLPVSLRQRFNFSPENLLAFLDDPKNEEEAVKLGLLPAKIIAKDALASTPEPPKSGNCEPPAAGSEPPAAAGGNS